MQCAGTGLPRLKAFPTFRVSYFKIPPFYQMSQFIRILRCIPASSGLKSESILEARVDCHKMPCTNFAVEHGQVVLHLRTV